MSIFAIVDEITKIRDAMEVADDFEQRRLRQELSQLLGKLCRHAPTTATEAFMMAADLTYMLREERASSRAEEIACGLTEGLMTLSKLELASTDARMSVAPYGQAH